MSKALKVLNDVLGIATSDGNWNANPYMHGMANGLILAKAIATGTEPKYLNSPRKYHGEEWKKKSSSNSS